MIAYLKACVLYVANGYKWEPEMEDFILVGKNDRVGWVSASRYWLNKLIYAMMDARDEPIWITIE